MKFNCRFNLKKSKSTFHQPQKIILISRCNGEKFVHHTPFFCHPKNWNTKVGAVKNVIAEPDRDIINNHLLNLERELKKLFNEAILNHIQINKEYYRKGLDKFTGKSSEKKITFKIWLQKYIDDSPNRINPKTGRTISKRTIQEYITTFGCLQDFEKENKEAVEFETFDLNTLKDFRDYLTTVKDYALNNIAKHLSNVQQFFRAAYDEKFPVDPDVYNPKKFYIAHEEAENVYLNEQEIKAISDLKLEGTKDLCRDKFILACNTGLRISDFNNLKSHEIKNNFLSLFQNKTGGKVVIPINEKIREILNKYDGNMPKISDQKLNQYLKIICKEAGIVEETEKMQTKGGKKISSVYKKYDMVSAHTARRSYASNSVRKGVPIQSIMRITGHKKESVFLKYVKLSPMEHAELLSKYSFL